MKNKMENKSISRLDFLKGCLSTVMVAITPFAFGKDVIYNKHFSYKFITPDYFNDGHYPSVKTGYYITSYKIIDRDAWFSIIGNDNYLDTSSTEEAIYGKGYDWTYAAKDIQTFSTLEKAQKMLSRLKSSGYNYYLMTINYVNGDVWGQSNFTYMD